MSGYSAKSMQRGFLLTVTLASLLAAAPAGAQHTIRGTVTDGESGAPIPAAHVIIEGSYSGTITNGAGAYVLTLSSLPATLTFRSIGYASQQHVVDQPTERVLDVRLQPIAYEMGEIVVTGDPAADIMRRVIEEKQKWYDRLETFRATAYARRVVANDTGIVFIVESLSDLFWSRGRGVREVLKSQRQTANAPFGIGDIPIGELANLYDDDVEMAGFRLVGVTHPRALSVYDFSLLGVRRIDDQLVYDIGVEPKSRLTPAFVGHVTVLEGAFALLEVNLRPNEAVLLPPPIRLFEMEVWQQFSNYGGPFWLPVDFRTTASVEISFGVLASFPEARFREVTRLTDYAINVPLPDTLFDDDASVQVDSAAVAADTLLENTASFVPLEPHELAAYQAIDSTDRIEEAFRPRGLLGRFADLEADTSQAEDDGGLALNAVPVVRYNRVEGAHLGLHVGPKLGPVRFSVGGGWSAELGDSKRWSRRAEVALQALPEERLVLTVSAEAAAAPRYESRLYPALLTSAYTLVGGSDYFDYYWRERLSATISTRPFRMPLTASVTYVAERPEPLDVGTGYDLLAHAAPPRPNPAVSTENLQFGAFQLTFGDAGYRLGMIGSSYVTVAVERGHQAEAWYGRYVVEAEHALPVFYRRRLLPAALYLRISAQARAGRLPLQRHGVVESRLGPYGPFGALRTLTGRPYEGDRHVGLFWEQSLRTLPFELLGLYRLARRGYTVLVHGAHARTWAPNDPGDLRLRAPNAVHHEVGISFSGLLGVFRVDLTRRLDAPGFSVGLGAARLF